MHQWRAGSGPAELTLASKLDELKEARNLSSEIVDSGARLHSLLAQEEDTKRARDRAVNFLEQMASNLESDDPQLFMERSIRMQIQEVLDSVGEKQRVCAELSAERMALQTKLQKKQEDLVLFLSHFFSNPNPLVMCWSVGRDPIRAQMVLRTVPCRDYLRIAHAPHTRNAHETHVPRTSHETKSHHRNGKKNG